LSLFPLPFLLATLGIIILLLKDSSKIKIIIYDDGECDGDDHRLLRVLSWSRMMPLHL
jgi:hypothetical protein